MRETACAVPAAQYLKKSTEHQQYSPPNNVRPADDADRPSSEGREAYAIAVCVPISAMNVIELELSMRKTRGSGNLSGAARIQQGR
jgi:hypothetical protein